MPPLTEVAWKTRRRHRSPLVLAVRFAGQLPYFMLAPLFLLPGPLSMPAAAAIALSYSVACHEISASLAARQLAQRDALAPLKGALMLFIFMLLCAASITYVFSPASYGPKLDTPLALVPALALLVLPCTLFFGIAQWHARSRHLVLFRLGLLSLTRRTGHGGIWRGLK